MEVDTTPLRIAWNLLTKTGPVKVTLGITNLCNLRCRTCNIWQIYRQSPELQREELNTEEWIHTISELKKTRYVSITGGEPTLRRDLPEIIGALDENRNVLAISINTNGAVVERIIDHIPEQTLLRTHISMMGPAKIDDELRGKGAHKQAVNAVRKLSAAGVETYVEFTATPQNIKYFDNLVAELDELGVPRSHIIITFYNVGEYYRNTGERFVSGDFARHALEMGINSPEMRIFLGLTGKYAGGTRKFCTAAKKSVYIDPFGNVYPCIFRLNTKMGNLREYGYNLEQLFRERYVHALREISKCDGCWTPCETIPGFAAYPWRIVL
ncbi:MAG: radical SAM protein [Candidatus Diapherotrites archaeon]|nr:radical SAM protein [Candidatus Diapherotrites archaeon]